MNLRTQFAAVRPSHSLAVVSAILAMWIFGILPRANAQIIVVNSGGSVTYLDSGIASGDFPSPITTAQFTSARTGPPAPLMTALNPNYITSLPHGPGAVWIGTSPIANLANSGGTTALYAASFTLPSNVTSASLTLYYVVDNNLGSATNPGVYINGTALPNSSSLPTSCFNNVCAFNTEQVYTDANIAPLLVSGTNWIYFDDVNYGGPAGLMFSAVITYTTSTATAVAAPGYAVSDFATGFVNSGAGGIGPIGLAFDALGNLYVQNYLTGILYKFPPSGGVASAATQVNTVAIPGTPAGLAFAKDGSLFCARQGSGDVVQLDPTTGAIIRTVAAIPYATGIVTDPISGDLFVSNPSSGSNSVYRISNFATTAGLGTVTAYASVAGPDGLSFGADGSLYAAAIGIAEIAKVAGSSSVTPGQVTYLNASIPSLDGIGVSANPNAQFLYTNGNNGVVTKVDLSTAIPTLTQVVTGGSRGDFVTVGPDSCFYLTQTDRILKVTNADGTCVPPPLGHLLPVTGSAQQWIKLAPGGGPPQGRVSPSAAYISGSNRLLIFGGYPVHTAGNQLPTNDLWALDGANGTGTALWTQLIPPDALGSPPRRTWAPASYDPVSNRMMLFGGENSTNFSGLNDVWVLADASGSAGVPTWSEISVSGTPPGPRANHAAAYDPVTNRLIVYGGVNSLNGSGGCPCTVYNDTWVLTNANGTGAQPSAWIQLSPTGTAPTLSQTAFAYDPAQNVLIVYGGYDGSGNPHTDTWILSNANGTGGTPAWTQLATVGSTPPQQVAPTAGYDPATQRFFIFGGDVVSGGTETSTNTTYVLSNATGKGVSTWQLLNISGTLPPARTQAAGMYDSQHNSFMVFGGQQIPQSVTFNDSWVLSNANGIVGSAGSHVSITTLSLPSGEAGIGYTATLQATGGTPPYTWSLSSGSLPSGLNPLSPSGVFSGTPSTAGTYNFTVQVTDSVFGIATQTYPVTIIPFGTGESSATIQPTSLAFGNQVVTTASTPQAVTVTSNGTAPLLISSIAVAGTNPTDFPQTNNCPLAPTGLGPGESCQIFVAFAPIAYGARSATLIITDNQGNIPGSQTDVTLTGTGADVPVAASTTYNITGNPFTVFTGSAACPPDCNISGSFTLSQPLPPNLSNATITPASFGFNVGATNLNQANVTSASFTSISTDASGYITSWAISLSNTNFSIVTNNTPGNVNDSFTVVSPQGTASNANSPAIWPKTVVTPLTFNASPTPVSNIATLNCPSGTVPCTDPNAHSLKLTVPAVSSGFTLTVTSVEVPFSEANGVCPAGASEATNFNCRFVSYFPLQKNPDGSVTVPQCVPYSNGNCVYYRVSNTPPETSYTPGVLEYIAWNDTSYTPPPFYNANNPRLLDDPDDPPYNINHQFVFDITTYYKPTGNYVGVDNGIGGGTKHFNDFVVAYPAAPSYSYALSFVPPLSSTRTAHFEQGDGLSVNFKLTPNTPAGIAMQAPHHVGYSVLLDINKTGCTDFSGTIERTATPPNAPTDFTYDAVRQFYDLRLRGIYPPGQYKMLLSSDIAPEQCAVFVVTKDN